MANKENKGMIDFPKRKKDWQYTVDVNYDYEYNCDEGCNPYCRCGVLVNLHVKPPGVYGALSFVDSFFVKGAGEEGKFGKALATRFFRNACRSFEDMFEVTAERGYYGEEIGGVYSTEHSRWDCPYWVTFRGNIEKFNNMSNSERVKFVLELEYGHVLPEVAQYYKWQMIEIPLKTLSVSPNHLNNLDDEIVRQYMWSTPWNAPTASQRELNSWFPGVLAIPKEEDYYRLIDGYHRYKAWTSQPAIMSDKKWKKMRKNKKIKIIAPVV